MPRMGTSATSRTRTAAGARTTGPRSSRAGAAARAAPAGDAHGAHQAPEQIRPRTLADYLDVMSRAVFQSGMSWRVVNAKWAGTREVLAGFDPAVLGGWGEREVDRAAQDTRLIRNRRKIEAVVENARALLEVAETPQAFRKYLRSQEDFDALVRALRKRFRFLGDMGAYYFLYVVGEAVPDYEEFCRSRGVTPMGAR
jgi:3-methyladenine DNA glycosylase Tag